MSQDQPQEMHWTIDGLRIAGLAWGEPSAPPVLALHGWLDNANSFAVLAPLLEGHYVVAIDLTGHGQSDRRSADATYNVWDDLPQILGVIDALGWKQCDLVGHSRGGIIATLFAAAKPDRIKKLVLLDALIPEPVEESIAPDQLGRFLDDRLRLMARDDRVLPDLESAPMARVRRGLYEDAARLLTSRAVAHSEHGVRWTSDPRLYGASASKLTAGQVAAVLGAIKAPVLVLLAEHGHARHPELLEMAREHLQNFESATLPGCHHFHMLESAPDIAQRIEEFLDQND